MRGTGYERYCFAHILHYKSTIGKFRFDLVCVIDVVRRPMTFLSLGAQSHTNSISKCNLHAWIRTQTYMHIWDQRNRETKINVTHISMRECISCITKITFHTLQANCLTTITEIFSVYNGIAIDYYTGNIQMHSQWIMLYVP